MTHINYSLRKLGKTFKLQRELLKTEKNDDETYADIWREKKSERVDDVKNDVLCTAFSYTRYSKATKDVPLIFNEKLFVFTRTRLEILQ